LFATAVLVTISIVEVAYGADAKDPHQKKDLFYEGQGNRKSKGVDLNFYRDPHTSQYYREYYMQYYNPYASASSSSYSGGTQAVKLAAS